MPSLRFSHNKRKRSAERSVALLQPEEAPASDVADDEATPLPAKKRVRVYIRPVRKRTGAARQAAAAAPALPSISARPAASAQTAGPATPEASPTQHTASLQTASLSQRLQHAFAKSPKRPQPDLQTMSEPSIAASDDFTFFAPHRSARRFQLHRTSTPVSMDLAVHRMSLSFEADPSSATRDYPCIPWSYVSSGLDEPKSEDVEMQPADDHSPPTLRDETDIAMHDGSADDEQSPRSAAFKPLSPAKKQFTPRLKFHIARPVSSSAKLLRRSSHSPQQLKLPAPHHSSGMASSDDELDLLQEQMAAAHLFRKISSDGRRSAPERLALEDDEDMFTPRLKRRVLAGGQTSAGVKNKACIRMKIERA